MKSFYTWGFIAAIIIFSTVGDVLQAHAMKKIGDIDELRDKYGLGAVVGRVLRSSYFLLGIAAMALAFFSLLLALSWADVSLVGPVSASLTFMATTFAARIFLHERVDARRWIAAGFVAAGVALLAL